MNKELVIHANSKGVEIALLENRRLVEYHLDAYEQEGFSVGDIYLGRVKKINPGLNAAFVDVGHDKDAFIHYTDLSPYAKSVKQYCALALESEAHHLTENFKPEVSGNKEGNIQDILEKGDISLFQISKEAISTKGPRLTCELSIAGRYIVLVPFSDSVGISKKIDSYEERNRLSSIIKQIKPRHYGIVVRTNAEGIKQEELEKDLSTLMQKWEVLTQKIPAHRAPKRLLNEMGKSFSIIRDLLNDSFSRVVTDSPKLYEDLRAYVKESAPSLYSIVDLHDSKVPLFEEFGVSKQVKMSFGKTVTLRSGAYLVIEHTEALHVIDVNSGPRINKSIDQEANALAVNIEAANEIARQLRLRDIGGIIVIDFIDMKAADYRHKLLEAMQLAMKPDKAKHVILPMSKFGIMELTRQRVREQLSIDTSDPMVSAPAEQSFNIADKITREILKLSQNKNKRYIVYVHPFLYAYLKQGKIPFTLRWFFKTKRWVKIISDSALSLSSYKIVEQKKKK